MLEIYTLSANSENFDKYSEQINEWSNGLWFPDFEEAGIADCYLVFDESEDADFCIGYQTVNVDGLCVAIEVNENHQGRGIARMLIEESGSYQPEDDQNPEFWAWAEENFNND